MAYDAIILLIGLIALSKSSDTTIKNAMKFSRISGVSQIAIGFIVIAIATSLPELTIAVISSLEGQGSLSMGNVFGSNIADMALIFGLISFFGFRVSKVDKKDTYSIVLLTMLIGAFILILRRVDAAFGLFVILIFYMSSKTIFRGSVKAKERPAGARRKETTKSLLYLLLAIVAVLVSAFFVVDSAVGLAKDLDIATTAIGATIVSMGTTIPELSIGLAAIRRKKVELAVGDSVGSLITNIALVLGVATLINPLSLNASATAAIISMLLISVVFMYLVSRGKFGKTEGITLLSIYAVYIATMLAVGAL